MLSKTTRLLSLLVILVLLGGCETQLVVSEWGNPTAAGSHRNYNTMDDPLATQSSPPHNWPFADSTAGIEYYLPKRLFKLTFTRELLLPKLPSKAKEAVTTAAAALANANKEKKKAATEYKNLNQIALKTPEILAGEKKPDKKASTSQFKDAKKAAAKSALAARGKFVVAETAANTANDKYNKALDQYVSSRNPPASAALVSALERAKAALEKDTPDHVKEAILAKLDETLQLETSLCKYKITFKIEDQGLVPDTRYRFVAQLNHSYFRHDNFILETTPNGLLSNATGSSDDKTGDVLVEIASAVAGVGGISPIGTSTLLESDAVTEREMDPSAPSEKPECRADKATRSFIIDPADLDSEAGRAAGVALSSFLRTQFVPRANDLALRFFPTWDSPGDKIMDPGCIDNCAGLFYRRDLPYVVSLEQCKNSTQMVVGQNEAELTTRINTINDSIDKLRAAVSNDGRLIQVYAGLAADHEALREDIKSVIDALKMQLANKERQIAEANSTIRQLQKEAGSAMPAHSSSHENFVGCGGENNIDKVLATSLVNMPNGSPIARVSFDSGGFVKTDHKVVFEDGMLKAHDVTRPSEVLSVASLPLKVVRAMLTTVTDVFRLRIDIDSTETSAAEQQLALLEAIRALEDAKDEQNED